MMESTKSAFCPFRGGTCMRALRRAHRGRSAALTRLPGSYAGAGTYAESITFRAPLGGVRLE
jgi:hypothetical protein